MLGGREPRAGLRPGHQDRPLVGSIAGVRAAVPGQARPRLGGSSQALRRGRARARAGGTGRSRAARGVLRALRLLGGAISGGTRAVWLANWLSAAVTCDAAQRTTTLAASLLHCAAKGQAAAEVSAVLLGMAGQEPLEPAASRLLAAPQGVDLAWGLVAGCRAALLLSVS